MFTIIFYIFSLLLSYTDFRRFIVPNNILLTMSFMLVFFGVIEGKVYISSFVMPIIVLGVFVVIILLSPKMILGGGDIKYMMVVALFLPYTLFPLFLIVTGVLQSLVLIYIQNIKKRRVAAMVPIIFLSVVITQLIEIYGFYTLIKL